MFSRQMESIKAFRQRPVANERFQRLSAFVQYILPHAYVSALFQGGSYFAIKAFSRSKLSEHCK